MAEFIKHPHVKKFIQENGLVARWIRTNELKISLGEIWGN